MVNPLRARVAAFRRRPAVARFGLAAEGPDARNISDGKPL